MSQLTRKEMEAVRHIRNWIAHRGRTPSVRELMQALGYRSPRSAQDVLEQLARKLALRKLPSGDYQLLADPPVGSERGQTVDVPLVGSVAAGAPILAEENVEAFIPISTALARPGGRYFLLRVRGDSMDRDGIRDGEFVLVRQQQAASAGDRVVALIDDEATVKEYRPGESVVVLQPHSSNPSHRPIVMDRDFRIQGVVVASVPMLEWPK